MLSGFWGDEVHLGGCMRLWRRWKLSQEPNTGKPRKQGKRWRSSEATNSRWQVTTQEPVSNYAIILQSVLISSRLHFTTRPPSISNRKWEGPMIEFYSKDLSIDFNSDLNIATHVFVFLGFSGIRHCPFCHPAVNDDFWSTPSAHFSKFVASSQYLTLTSVLSSGLIA